MWIDGDDVLSLIEGLRRADFPIGVQEYLDALEVAELCRQPDGGVDPAKLRNWLAPVLCTDPDEQREFYRRFHAWWGEQARAQNVPGGLEDEPVLTPWESEEDLRRSRPTRWLALLAGLVVLLSGALFAWDRSQHRVLPPEAIVVASAPDTLRDRDTLVAGRPEADDSQETAGTFWDRGGRDVPGSVRRPPPARSARRGPAMVQTNGQEPGAQPEHRPLRRMETPRFRSRSENT